MKVLQLKRLEAYGFKSFADKIEIEFDQGITAIVGPNGSGKSNITDAVRWVLGEQNVRNLRGTKAEDIIFTGSASRKALGVAEVSLLFDNTGELPVDFKEVLVTRRLFRSGESEFYINRSRCRLKDIYNLFADTGIGHDGMSIIGQNRIDDILNSKPEDRRAFFEETAGITKYRNRKRESVRKLEDTEHNLERVTDIIHEIETQLEPLARHAEKTRQFNVLQGEYRKCRLTGIHQKLDKLAREEAENQQTAQQVSDEALALDNSMKSMEAQQEQLGKEAIDIEKTMQAKAEANEEIRAKLEAAGTEIATLQERQKQSDAAKERILQQRRELEEAKQAAEADIAQLAEAEGQQQSDLALAKELIGTEKQKASALEKRIRAQKETSRQAEEERERCQSQLAEKQKELALAERDLEAGSGGQSERERQLSRIRDELSDLQAEQERLSGEEAALQEQRDARAVQQKELQAKRDSLSHALGDSRQRENRLQQAIESNEGKVKFLDRMQKSYEGFGRAAKAVLQNQAPWSKGVCGAVAELLHVPQDYVTAIEVSLGGNMQNIVVEDTDTAKAAIAFLKQGRLGRVTFLPLSTIVVRSPGERDFQGVPGVIGYASELVKMEPKYSKIAEFLLGRTLVVDTLDHALALAKKQGYRMRIVTLEGELLSPGGSLSGGSRQQKETSFLNRSGEIDSLRQQIAKDQEILKQTAAERESLARQMEEADAEWSALSEQVQQANVRQAELRVACTGVADSISSKKNALQDMEKQMADMQQAFSKMQEKRVLLRREAGEWEKKLADVQKQAEEAFLTLEDLEQDAEDLSKYINQREVNCAVLEQQAQKSREHILLRTKEVERSREALDRNHQEEQNLAQELSGSGERLQELMAQSAQWQERFDAGAREQKALYEQKMSKLEEAHKQETLVKETGRKRNVLQNKLHQLELAISKIQFSREECEETLLTEYGLTPERAAEEAVEASPEDNRRRLQELERQIDALGPVNPAAVEQYEELSKRHEFMLKQSGDLVEAKDNLLAILADMDDAMTKQFKEAFAKIQVYFGEIFVRLFGGGKAELRLLDPEDVLNTGVEILVQLPQKKRQNLSALSGGERALTVIALLFSFLRYKPSPFSVLDEIDAPLDEANVVRFGTFLREFAENTQFIVVTHRKGTMESVDSMYGVTIEDAGVSKILSVKIDDVKLGN